MNERQFNLRMHADYTSDKNKIDTLEVEVLHDGEWEPVELGIRSPGFLLFINALFTCQHLYMRSNCAERGIELASASGELQVVTNEVWEIQRAAVSFVATIRQGEPTAEAVEYIIERMHHCPVSTNLPDSLRLSVNLDFEKV
jgi:hypothetical protein